MNTKQILQAQADSSVRLDVFVASRWSQYFSRSQAQKNIHGGLVCVNNKQIQKVSYLLQENDNVQICYQPPLPWHIEANHSQKIPVIYQDEFLAVVHKPAAMTVHPGAGTGNDTLVHYLLAQMDSLSEGSQQERPGIVHRLDRDTEGLLLIAKTNQAHAKLAALFAERKIHKSYRAWLCGFPQESAYNFEQEKQNSASIFCNIKTNGTSEEKHLLQGYIQRHPSAHADLRKRMLFTTAPLHERSKYASLAFSIEKEIFPFVCVSIDLYTGRTHQIRAAFQYLHTPVVNDNIYGDKNFLKHHNIKMSFIKLIQNNGLLLVADSLCFVHPFIRKEMNFSLPKLPRFAAFEQILAEISDIKNNINKNNKKLK